MSEHLHTNKLIDSSSPYLLQHAHNPVDWHEWNEGSLKKASSLDKPIIVSIGYSACHWCHVMERESFENEAIAEIMNKYFICIKVDREERPDVDQIYMDAVHAMGLQGGWPLNVFLTPDQRPFYGGTYFPPTGWGKLLQQIAQVFKEKRAELEKSADGFMQSLGTSEVKKYGLTPGESDFKAEGLSAMFQKLSSKFDREKGGLGNAPKFPMPVIYAFLLREFSVNKNQEALAHIQLTLNEMAKGGLYDQVGGGFTRYSTDSDWFVPHFEKMLYDNGQLVSLYADAYSITQEPLYQETVYQTIEWLEREMTSPQGGFYAALDADSEGVEGKFYLWTVEEFQEVLGPDADLMIAYYNLSSQGNWEPQKNIPFRTLTDEKFAQEHDLTLNELKDLVKASQIRLLQRRSERIRPGLDDKILSGWNGLILKGLVDAYGVFQEERFLNLAIKNADFVLDKMKSGSKLLRNYKDGKASIDAYLEDYAAVAQAFIALYQVTFDEQWLNEAAALVDYTIAHFYDDQEHFFFFTDDNSEALITRKKEIFDNVIAGSNSIMASNLHRLGILLDNDDYRQKALLMIRSVKKLMATEPQYLTNWACLYSDLVKATAEVVVISDDPQKEALELMKHYIPNKVLLGAKSGSKSGLPLLENREMINGETTFYVCRNKTCQLPVNSLESALEQII